LPSPTHVITFSRSLFIVTYGLNLFVFIVELILAVELRACQRLRMLHDTFFCVQVLERAIFRHCLSMDLFLKNVILDLPTTDIIPTPL